MGTKRNFHFSCKSYGNSRSFYLSNCSTEKAQGYRSTLIAEQPLSEEGEEVNFTKRAKKETKMKPTQNRNWRTFIGLACQSPIIPPLDSGAQYHC